MADYSIQLGVKVNTKDIDTAINKYKGKPIEVKSSLDTSGIDKKIASYKVKKPIEINAQLNTSGLAKKIGDYKPKTPIKLGAKLDTKSIDSAIRNYKAKKSIEVDIKLNHKGISEQLRNYKPKSPIKVDVKLDSNDITKQIRAYQTKAPIKLGVKLTTKDIDEKIRNYKAKTPIKLDVKINKSVINEQIKSFNPKNTIKLKAALQKGAIAEEIRKYKPNTPIKVDLELDYSDIDRKIGEYIAKGAVELPVKLKPATKDFSSGITKTPIKVNAELNPDSIKNISSQLTGLQPETPIIVKTKLDDTAIDNAISDYQSKTPTIKVNIKVNDNDIDEETRKQNAQKPIQVHVKLDRKNIEEQIRNFTTKTKIKIGIKLDSKGIAEQIKKIEPKTKVKVGIQIDPNDVAQQIGNINTKTPIRLGVELDPNGVQNVENQIDNLRQQLQNLPNVNINIGGGTGGGNGAGGGNGVGNADRAFQRASREIYNLYKQIEGMELKLNELGKSGIDSSNIEQYRTDLDELRQTYKMLLATLNGQNGDINLDAMFTDIDQAKTSITKLSSEIDNARTKLAKNVKIGIDNGSLKGQIDAVEQKFNQLGIKNQQVTDNIAELRRLLGNMKDSNDIESVTSDYQEFLQLLKTVNNNVVGFKMQMDEANRPEILDAVKESAMQRLNGLFDEGSQAAKVYGARVEELRNELNQVGNVKGVEIVNKKIKNLGTEIKNSKLQTQTLGSRLKEQFSRYSNYLSIASVFMYATQAMRSMFEQVKLIDSAMTELKKVTNETDASYNNFLNNAASRAKELGTTIDGLVSSTADFARLGYGFKDSQQLAEVANIYAVVGDEIDGVEDATQSLVSTMAAFKSEMNGMNDGDFAMGIVDKMNEVSNNFAISSGGIGEALQRSASSMAAANNTLDETIAMITAANEVAQNPEKVGNAMKTMSMRIRGAKTELEEAGESTDGMAESTASLRAEIKALSGVDIMLNENTFKSTYQIMDELSKKWEDLSDIAQATIIELVAGKHQGNVFSSLMANFQTARDALTTSLGSSGSAMKEHAKWSESLEARLNKLSSAWQSLSQTFMNSDFLKVGIDFITGLVNVVDKLVDSLGTLGIIGLGAGITGFVKNFGTLKTLAKDVFTALTTDAMNGYEAWTKWNKASDGVVSGGKKLISSFSGIAGAIGLVVAAAGLAYNAYKNAKEAAAEARQETIRASDEYLDAATSFEKAYIKYSGKTDLTSDEEAELASAINGTVDALGDKSSALQNAVNNSNDYLASLEAIKNAELEAAKKAAEDKKDAAAKTLEEAAIGWATVDGSEVGINISSTEADAAKVLKGMKSSFDIGLGDSRYNNTMYSGRIDLPTNANTDKIIEYYNFLLEYKDKLSDANLKDTTAYKDVASAIEKMSESISVYVDGVYEAAKANYQLKEGIPKTTDEYIAMREAILKGDDIKGLSIDTKMGILNTLDSEYGQLFDLTSVEAQARKLVGIIKHYGDGTIDGTNEIGTMETFLNMRTAVNNDECTVGDYLSQFDKINDITKGWSEEEKKILNTTFGLDTDAIKKQYDNVYNYLSRNYLNKDIRNMDRDEERYYKLDVRENKKKIEEFLNSLSASQLAAVVDIKAEIDWENASEEDIRKQIEERVKINEALSFSASIEIDTTALETLNTALEESASAMGLSEEAIESLKAKYSELDGYNPDTLFERTANGVKLNREELAKLEKKYNDLNKSEVQKHIDNLTDAYNDNAAAIDECRNAGERAQLIANGETYKNKIEELATYQAQLEGVTGAYQKWIDAQNTPEDYEGYQAVATSREDIKDEISRGFISNASKEYIDLLSGKELTGGTIDDYANAWEKLGEKVTSTGYSIHDFFTVNDDGDITATGIDRFMQSVKEEFDDIYNSDTGIYDFSQESLKKIQDEWGIGIEAIELLLEAAASAGYDVDWSGILDNIDLDTSDFETLVSFAEKAQSELNKLENYENLNFNFSTTSVEDATTEIEKAKNAYSELINKDGKINLEADGAEQMRVILSTLLVQKQQLEDSEIAINISTSGLDDAQAKAVAWVQDFRTKYKNLEIAISTGEGIDEAKTELETVKTSLGELDGDTAKIAAQLVLGEGTDTSGDGFKTQVNNAIDAIGKQDINVGFKLDETDISNLNSQLLTNFTVDATAKISNVDKSQLETVETNGMVNWNENTDNVSKSFEANGTVNWDDNVANVKKSFSANGTVKWTSGNKVKVDVISEATGTAHVGGTASGRAFARGNWGIKGSGTALGGELAPELLVREGKWHLIGEDGAEFFQYKPNDIIFNAAQTESLFKYGGIKGAKPRGTMLATGTAFADGSYQSSGKAFAFNAKASTSKFALMRVYKSGNELVEEVVEATALPKRKATAKDSDYATVKESDFTEKRTENKSSKTSSSSSSSAKDDFKETFDWVEVAISRIERAIDQLDQKANNVYKSWSERNSALTSEIDKVGDEISLQQQAYDRYIQEANSVGLSSSWAEKVRNGKIDIETIKDEVLKEKIDDYTEW